MFLGNKTNFFRFPYLQVICHTFIFISVFFNGAFAKENLKQGLEVAQNDITKSQIFKELDIQKLDKLVFDASMHLYDWKNIDKNYDSNGDNKALALTLRSKILWQNVDTDTQNFASLNLDYLGQGMQFKMKADRAIRKKKDSLSILGNVKVTFVERKIALKTSRIELNLAEKVMNLPEKTTIYSQGNTFIASKAKVFYQKSRIEMIGITAIMSLKNNPLLKNRGLLK